DIEQDIRRRLHRLPEIFAFGNRERAVAALVGWPKGDDYRYRRLFYDLRHSFHKLRNFLLEQTINSKLDDISDTRSANRHCLHLNESRSADGNAYECWVRIGGHRSRGDAFYSVSF